MYLKNRSELNELDFTACGGFLTKTPPDFSTTKNTVMKQKTNETTIAIESASLNSQGNSTSKVLQAAAEYSLLPQCTHSSSAPLLPTG